MPDALSQQSTQDTTPVLPQNSSTMPIYSPNIESMPIAESMPLIEVTPERQENLPRAEIPIPAALKEKDDNDKKTPIELPVNEDVVIKAVVPKVVSKKAPLHHIEHPANDLTQKADAEEEDFIKHVEEIHTLI